MSTGRHAPLEREWLVDVVEAAYARDETMLAGGVSAETVADELEINITHARKRLRNLAEAGALERVYGVKQGVGPVHTYVLTDGGAADA